MIPTTMPYRVPFAVFVALTVLAALAACSTEVDTSGLEPVQDYSSWYRLDSTGPVPGHGDTYRIIYANDVARSYSHAGEYPVGSMLVKEIRELADDDMPGDLRYLAVMRKVTRTSEKGEIGGVDIEGGWLLTSLDTPSSPETYRSLCWGRCHVQAPVDGAWFDYGR